MTIDIETANSQESSEYLQGQAINKHKQNKLSDALALYLQSIELNENQPEWIYSNAITLAAQINRFDRGNPLGEKAIKLYPHNDEIIRAVGLLSEKQNRVKEAIYFYHKAISINPSQPEWVYLNLYNILISQGVFEKAKLVKQQGLRYFPKSAVLIAENSKEIESNNTNSAQNLQRETPIKIEKNVDLDVKKTRRQLMDRSIVEQYEILLEQTLFNGDRNLHSINSSALLSCLAEIKTDIHYLKTKVLESSTELVDPQAIQKVDIENIVNCIKPIPIKCDLKNKIVGAGWHSPEIRGRWTGDSTISSLVFPYPTVGKYRLEIIIREEAKKGLLQTLKINICDRPISISNNFSNCIFPLVITEEIEIIEEKQSFLNLDLILAETVRDSNSSSRLIGLLIEQISLIPND